MNYAVPSALPALAMLSCTITKIGFPLKSRKAKVTKVFMSVDRRQAVFPQTWPSAGSYKFEVRREGGGISRPHHVLGGSYRLEWKYICTTQPRDKESAKSGGLTVWRAQDKYVFDSLFVLVCVRVFLCVYVCLIVFV